MSLVCQRCSHENADEARFCLRCGNMLETQAEAAPEDPLIGKVLLDRYRVLSILGEGGMGKVYLAEQKMGTATRKVAIKTLHPELGADPQLIARFHRECETVIALSHPNTVQFYDFGEIDRILFIVMEFIEGQSLADLLEQEAIEPDRADRILIQICGSLHEAHQHGVVHRDLKPENVLLTQRGGQTEFVKVLDFGIAKRSEAEDRDQAKLTKQGMVLGTPPYMSPEQFSGQTLDARSDIYSLGMMTYEMVTGRLPFEAATPWEWATKHLTAQPTPVDAHPTGARLPEHKKAALLRALAKDREQRPASVLEFMHEFTGLGDPQSAWTLATTPGAQGAASSSPAAGGQAEAPARPAAPTPGPMAATDAAYAPTMATPASGQMARTDASGMPAAGADQPAGVGLAKVFAVLAVLALVVVAGGAGALWYFLSGGEGEDVASADEGEAEAEAAEPQTGGEAEPSPSGVPSTPPEAEEEGGDPGDPEPDPEPDEREEASGAAAGADSEPADSEPDEQAGPDPRLAKARSLLRSARAALGQNDLGRAATALARARRILGGRHATVRKVQAQLARKGSNQVGILMQQGNCKGAQALYRQLRRAGAGGPSAGHFSSDWCPRP